MKTRAAVLRKGGEPWELIELDLVDPLGRERGGIAVTGVRRRRWPAPQACADCLVPKDLMRGILGQTLGVPEDAIDLIYPLDTRQER